MKASKLAYSASVIGRKVTDGATRCLSRADGAASAAAEPCRLEPRFHHMLDPPQCRDVARVAVSTSVQRPIFLHAPASACGGSEFGVERREDRVFLPLHGRRVGRIEVDKRV